MKKQMVGEVPGNVLGMMADLALKLQNGVITLGQFGRFLKKENPFIEGDFSEVLTGRQNFWRKITGNEYDFSKLHIPVKPEGKWRLLITVDITLEALYAKCKEMFPCWRWTDKNLDTIVVKNERDAENGPYAIWVKDGVEADENLKNKSANDIEKDGISTETLAERLVHELEFFLETGKHLDVKNITLCSGSRYDDGHVPVVRWFPHYGKMLVHWYYPVRRDGRLRSRQAVS
ncbi:MAG: hypothetical protein AB1643_02170 [Patescibacteria group bacterium]